MKIEKKSESFYILGYLLELIIKIWRFGSYYFSKSDEFGTFFSMENPLYLSKSYFSSRIWQNFAKTKNTGLDPNDVQTRKLLQKKTLLVR
jgi:hypothetical protein